MRLLAKIIHILLGDWSTTLVHWKNCISPIYALFHLLLKEAHLLCLCSIFPGS